MMFCLLCWIDYQIPNLIDGSTEHPKEISFSGEIVACLHDEREVVRRTATAN